MFKSILKFYCISIFLFLISGFCFAQTPNKGKTGTASLAASDSIKSSPAYAEVLLRKVELESTLEDLLESYTKDFPKVKETQFELGQIQKASARLLSVSQTDASKLTLALGKLIVRKAEYETALWSLRLQYNDDYPEVKRAKRRVEIFDKAINEILP
jgi:hypothetical protein